jgi:hypothetical protein
MCIMSRILTEYTSDKKDDPIICSGVIALFVFSALAPWWPSQESDQAETWAGRLCDLGVHMYKASGQ